MLPIALVVTAILVLGIGSFAGARWWLNRATDGTAAPPASALADPTASAGSRPGKAAAVPTSTAQSETSLAPATITSSVAVTVVVTTVTAPLGTTTPGTSTVLGTTAASAPDLAAISGVPRQDVGCDGSYVVVLASALGRDDFATTAAGFRDRYPGAKYLVSGSSCLNFRSGSAYVLYEGTYPTVSDACAARFAGTRDAYVKVADPTVTDRTVSCLCPPPGSLPELAAGSKGTYVTEAQYALLRLGFYAGNGTGIVDAETEQAVRALQSGKSLPVDGRVDAATWSALTGADCAS